MSKLYSVEHYRRKEEHEEQATGKETSDQCPRREAAIPADVKQRYKYLAPIFAGVVLSNRHVTFFVWFSVCRFLLIAERQIR